MRGDKSEFRDKNLDSLFCWKEYKLIKEDNLNDSMYLNEHHTASSFKDTCI